MLKPATEPPRMLMWVLVSVVLIVGALWAHQADPGSVVAVSLYKAHLLALGGWGGYWLDRALFPYDRPHQHLEVLESDPGDDTPFDPDQITAWSGGLDPMAASMLRRAIIVAACLVCVGLGA